MELVSVTLRRGRFEGTFPFGTAHRELSMLNRLRESIAYLPILPSIRPSVYRYVRPELAPVGVLALDRIGRAIHSV